MDDLGPLAFLGFILLQASQVVAAPVPGEVTGLLGGYVFGKLLGVVLSTIGLTIGSFIAFTLSRKLGRPFVEKVVSPATLARFDYLLHHKGAFIVFLMFLIPGFPKDYLCYILGLGHLSTSEFLIIGGTGRLLGTVMLTLGGDYLRNQEYYKFFILTGIALLFILIAYAYKDKIERVFRLWHISKYRKKREKRRKLNA
ncbi:MAG: VTT domain-containing protein [Thermodesulfovibrionales bacterium]|nr:VTT domain-containing protein [Thermodesulfovibrionales bacterium]